MDIARELGEIGVLLDKDRLVSALKQMAAALTLGIVIDRIGGIQALHDPGEISLGGLKEKMIMVVHKTPGIQVEFESVFEGFQIFKELSAVGLINEDLLAVIAAAGDVVKTSFSLQSIWPGHENILAAGNPLSRMKLEFGGLTLFVIRYFLLYAA